MAPPMDAAAVARHNIFDKLTLSVIAFNAIWIAVETVPRATATARRSTVAHRSFRNSHMASPAGFDEVDALAASVPRRTLGRGA